MNINNSKRFSQNFITKFLDNGFGTMAKRELEVYLLHLLLEDGQFVNRDGEIDYHEMSLALRISETKVRNLFYEAELKFGIIGSFDKAFVDLIEKGSFEADPVKKIIRFSVQSPLLKQAFEYEVRKLGGISDGSFSKQIVTIKEETFAKLLCKLYGAQVDEQLLNRMQNELNQESDIEVSRPTLFRIFAEEFIKTSGGKTAEMLFANLAPVAWLKALILTNV